MTTSPWPQHAPDHDPAAASPYLAAPSAANWYGAGPQISARPDYGIRKALPVVAWIVMALVVAGVLGGLIWHAISPRPDVLEGAGGSFQLPADTDKNYFGAEASFFLVTAVAGMLSGFGAWTVGRRRGPAVATALAIGSVIAGVIARAVGEAQSTNATLVRACGNDAGFDSICQIYDGHLKLRVVGLVLMWAITALAMFLTLSYFSDRPARKDFASPTWVAYQQLQGAPHQTAPPQLSPTSRASWAVGSWPDPIDPTAGPGPVPAPSAPAWPPAPPAWPPPP